MSDSGDGYNSADYDYKFFKVLKYEDTSPAKLTFQVVGEDGVGLTTNPGIAKTFQVLRRHSSLDMQPLLIAMIIQILE